jgi:hypothetical protein
VYLENDGNGGDGTARWGTSGLEQLAAVLRSGCLGGGGRLGGGVIHGCEGQNVDVASAHNDLEDLYRQVGTFNRLFRGNVRPISVLRAMQDRDWF